VGELSGGVERAHALVRIDDSRPPALYRIPFSLAAIGLVLVALQAGQPVVGMVIMGAALATAVSLAWSSFTRRHAPALALRAQAERELRRGRYAEARVLYERALGLIQRDLPPSAPEVLLSYYSLATVHSMLHEHERADDYLDRLLLGLEQRIPASWRGQVAWLLRRVAHQHSLEGNHGRAIELCDRALELVGPAPGADDNTVRSILDDIAWIHHHAGEYASAERMFREALALHEQFRDAALEVAQRPARGVALAESPYRVPGPAIATTTGGLDRAVAYSLLGLGWTVYERARFEDARSCFERASLIASSLGGRGEGDRQGGRGVSALQIEILRGRAAIEMTLGRYDAARELYEQARAHGEGGDSAMQAAALAIDLGWLARCQARHEDAEAIYESALEAIGRREEGMSTIACALHESMAELRRRQGRQREALREIQRAAVLADECLGCEHPRVAAIEAIASRIHSARSDFVEAERCARRCFGVLRAALGHDHPRFGEGYVALGEMHLGRGQWGAAERAFERALELRERAFGVDHPELVEVLDGLAAVMRATGRENEAEALERRSATLRDEPRAAAEPSRDGDSLAACG
jgi:tetratricopeptide (TPR) repeat protein